LKFKRQQPIGPYIADFYGANAAMVVELDGRTHAQREDQDSARDAWMHARGILVVRMPVWWLSQAPDRMVERVGQIALERIDALRKSGN